MKTPVIAIGLDAASPALIDAWMSEGHLENIRRLREQGTYAPVKNLDYYRAETPWTTFLTGCTPKQTGYWSPIKFRQASYDAELVEAYDFQEYPPFYALGEDYRVAVFDMPHVRLADNVNGVQIMAWGAHSPQGPSESRPASLFQELVDKHGPHPGLHNDHASCFDLNALNRLQHILETGIARRAAICQDLLQRQPWDLFLTVFGETHAAGHFMWHLSQTDHPLYNLIGAGDPGDRMLEVFKAVDRAIGEILASAPEDAHVLVFAAHGMGPNVLDVPSMTFLPEFLYRYSFPGKVGIADGKIGTPLQPPILECQKNSWLWEVWSTKHDSNPLRKWLRRNAPYRLFKRLEPFLGSSSQPDLISPFKLLEQGDPLYFQPATWYKPCWSKMTAFAIPSFSEGYIRLNVKGREAHGIVSPSDYEAVCDDICQKLNQLIDGRTGKPMVKEIIRIRQAAGDRDVRLPDADLVVLWKDDCPTDVVESPEFGRIGPVPHFRAGSHIPDGFLIAQGPGIEANSTLPAHSALDLTPTILSLMGAPIPDYFEGTPIFESAALPV